MLPLTEQIDPLIIFKHILVAFQVARHNRRQIARDMPSIGGQKVAGRVIPVVVLGCQIYDTKLDFIASLISGIDDSLRDRYSFMLIFLRFYCFEPKQELVDSIVMPFDAIDSTLSVVDFSKTKDLTIAR